MSQLRIAPGLALDADYVGGGTFALLAKKGAGKTYQGRVMCEEFWKAKVPFVVLDPMDAWWGLRAAADGKGEGIPVAIFGGPHGDAPLERTSGTLMADLVVDEGLSMVLSLKHFGTRAAERQFALDFLERLYRRNSELVHLLIDEADLFAPQKPQEGDKQLLGVTENIVRRGRNSGIGCTLITQRPAVLNKDVLTQVDGLVAMRIIGLQDREAIDKWVEGHGDDPGLADQVKGTLAALENGECWWWVPELGILKRVQVRKSNTFDSSPTRKRGQRAREPKSFADVDMGAIGMKMADTIKRAKAEDPKELKVRIRELEKQLRERPSETTVETKVETVVERVEVSVLTDADRSTISLLRDFERDFEEIGRIGRAHHRNARDLAAKLEQRVGKESKVQAPAAPRSRGDSSVGRAPVRQAGDVGSKPAPRSQLKAPQAPPVDGDLRLSGSQQKLLDALAWFEAVGLPEPKRAGLSFMAGSSSKSSGFEKNLSTLRTAGLLTYPQPNCVGLTDAGRARAVPPATMPTSEELQGAVMLKVTRSQAVILDVLIEIYPDALDREGLADAAGVAASSSGFEKNLSTLRTLGLVEYPGQGLVVAQDVLFLEAA